MSAFETLIEDFEDGQRPGGTKQKQRLAINKGKQSVCFLSVFDELVPDIWCARAYEYALSRNGKPFGIYILTSEALDKDLDAELLWNSGEHQKALALVTTRALVFERGRSMLEQDIAHIHGTAVWCLSSGVTNSVSYHIDYAELYRYETNVTHPPLYAGTWHASPLGAGDMRGGEFMANMRGLAHYRRFGYKGRLAQEPGDAHGRTALEVDMESDPAWQTIRYRCNRGIFHDGDLPHLSTSVQGLTEGSRRVIFGFNCFSDEVGESCMRAPEHSDAFNRTVKLYQAMAAPKGNAEQNGQLRAKDVLKNPKLAKLLVTAAKKVKDHKEATGEDFLSTMPKNLA